MAYTKYSLTPSSNTAAPPDGAPEGMLPSAVNDTMRDMMSQIRDCGDGIRDGTYTMTAAKITGGSITGVTFTSIIVTGGTITGITDLAVADGGTGASTLTGVLKGNGTSAFTAATAGTDYVTPTGTETLTNKTLTNPTITNFTESVVVIGTVGASHTLVLTNGTVQTATLTGSTPCTFTMPTATAGKSFILKLTQSAANMTTATFTGVKFSGGTAPTITATANAVDILSFVADGTNWYGSAIQNLS
jgi:hypothetical protein